MAFTGLSTHEMFTAGPLNVEDVSSQIALLAADETPLLDWIGDSPSFARDTTHVYLEEELRPNYLTTSTAIASTTANTGFQISDFGDLLTAGTLIEEETSGEVLQVVSIPGSNSLFVSRNFGGTGNGAGSLAPGSQLFVRGNYALEGADHTGRDVTRKRRRKTNYVGLFHVPIAVSGTQLAISGAGNTLGQAGGDLEYQTSMRIREGLRDLEKEVIRGVLSAASIGSDTLYRTFKGLRSDIGSINSTVTASSFAADPHLYIGNVWEQAFKNGAAETETWGIVAGRTYYRNISDMNASKVQDSNQSEQFKRVIRNYEGPFGRCSVFLSRWMPATSCMIIPRERVRVLPLQGRAFQVLDTAKTGDSVQRLLVGEYTVEAHHTPAMAQLKS